MAGKFSLPIFDCNGTLPLRSVRALGAGPAPAGFLRFIPGAGGGFEKIKLLPTTDVGQRMARVER